MRRTRAVSLFFLLASGTIPASGCATILRGTRERVHVTSESRNATVFVDGHAIVPGTIALDRDDDHDFVAKEPGKRSTHVKSRNRISWSYAIVDTLLAVVFFPVGLVAPILDLADGAMFHLDPSRVDLPAPREPAP